HARRADDGAATRQDPPAALDVERHPAVLQHTAPTVGEADDLVLVHALGLADHGADHCVEPGAVAAARQHTYAHRTPPAIGITVRVVRRARRRCGPGRTAAAVHGHGTDGRHARP